MSNQTNEGGFFKIAKKDIQDCISIFTEAFSQPPWEQGWNDSLSAKRLDFLLSIPTCQAYCYKLNNELVAFWVGFMEEAMELELTMKEIVVKTKFQGMGIGKLVMDHIEEQARLLGAKKITLSTLKGSYIEEFYTSVGYSFSEGVSFMNKEMS